MNRRSEMVVFLQNAWSPVWAGNVWPRDSWLRALARSRSGQRLIHLLSDFDACENTTPQVGASADSLLPPDIAHIAAILANRAPAVVVTCGKQAETTLARLWPGPLLSVPHPAHRLVTNELYKMGRRLLSPDYDARLALRQAPGTVRVERIA